MQIRRADIFDTKEISAIENAAFAYPWTEGMLYESLNDKKVFSLAAEDDDGRLCAYCMTLLLPPYEGCVLSIATHPDFRRKGLAREMLTETFAEAEKLGIKELTLEVRVGNTAAISLYESLGFKNEGIRKNYYEDGEDAVIMWRR